MRKRRKLAWEIPIKENVLVVLIILLGLSTVGVSIYACWDIDTRISSLKENSRKLFEIESFTLDFSRLLCILRDIFNGTYSYFNRSWAKHFNTSY